MCKKLIYLVSFILVLGLVGSASAALPAGWQSQDINTTGGSADESDGTWTVSGDGADVWGSSDEFHYVYRELAGDGEIVAQIVSNGEGSNTWAKGGVMIRETLDADSKHMIAALTGGDGGGIAFQGRMETGGSSTSFHGDVTAAPPYWVKLTRAGNTITAYSSADGVAWDLFTDTSPDGAHTNPIDVEMANPVLIGLFVTSHAAGELRTFTFDNVEFTEEPVNPGTDGLAAYYALENDVLDGSGNGNDGTIVGAPIFVEGPASYGMAMEFDGESYVDCGSDASLDVTGPISMGIWIRPGADDPEVNGTEAAVMAKADSVASPSWSWQVRYGWNSPQPYMAFTFNTSPRAWVYVGKNLERDEWAHIACSHDGETLKCYLNGEQTDSTPMGAITSSPTSVLIGSDGWRSDWIGAIDEVAIYDRALSDSEIRYLAGERATPVDPGTDGLVAFYALDGDANDSSGNELHGTIVGDAAFAEGKVGMALDLDGDGDYVDCGNPPELILTEAISIACWVNPTAFVGRQGFAGLDLGYVLKVHEEGRLCFTTPGIADHESSNTILEAGTWQHVAATFLPGQDEGLVFYLNGEETERMTSSAINTGTGPFRIGNNQWDELLTGLIDEVAIYGRALSAGEVRYLAGERAGDSSLVIYYDFDEVSDIVADKSGKGHDGVVVGDVTAEAEGMIGGAGNFANGGYLDLDGPSIPAEDIPTSAMTLAAWIKIANTGGDHEIFNARASDETWIMHPEPKSSGDIRWLLRSYGGTTIFQIRAGTVTWDQWLHFAGTYDKDSGKAALYINGELIEELDVENPADIAGDWGLGARVGKTIDDARPFTGLMDELRMYKRALSQDEVVEVMQGM